MKKYNEQKARILLVDDEKFYIDVLVEILNQNYQVIVAKDGESALQRATHEDLIPDLILLDILMPDIDGYEVCQRLKQNPLTRDIPVIFLTVKSEVDDELRGFTLGAVDYITKPISPPIVESRVANHLALARGKRILSDENSLLELRVQERTKEIRRTQDVAIRCMASLAETRDNETGNHIKRTQYYIRLLCEKLKDHPEYKEYLTEDTVDRLFRSAPLHDIGKVGIPDQILMKPGKLTEDEWVVMRTHSQLGYDALVKAECDFGTTEFLAMAKEVTLTHHEKWDGSGYPQGLKGSQIPIFGRLMALADVYDALVNKRVYKEAYSHGSAVEIILESSGSHFDPVIVEAFKALEGEFNDIAIKFADS
ncbi:MAG: two-component system response regulator [Candidatus Thiodiazotropha lotti]|uniref:HD-GYP domain-containing protein n=1 Tax=Candidatus Thiodiazotropha endoloripes TaxID=1818881 RepID=UPI00083CAD5F|nr:two-component system response regulator [Candidatus Thiodiazotropha endoloripes]MCG7900528.1 two-component system response regulator [Candidatus Thiodiazotropha weberae]MCG7993630.1 two-component system response regulator [Candidatus Thiodiazotropha lotti]MCG8001216.1 two-component system response regulator [Candidatus Thiodiazotropha lotti]MCW4185294.1 two-component system response regulator [Candidatus Thiodiazotropha weberae]MCW4192990.1 two-component system response regulator [Candidatu